MERNKSDGEAKKKIINRIDPMSIFYERPQFFSAFLYAGVLERRTRSEWQQRQRDCKEATME